MRCHANSYDADGPLGSAAGAKSKEARTHAQACVVRSARRVDAAAGDVGGNGADAVSLTTPAQGCTPTSRLYGTQFTETGGKFVPRRAEAGLEPFGDDQARMRALS